MGGQLCNMLNYLADSNEQIFILANAPEIVFNVSGLGFFLYVK